MLNEEQWQKETISVIKELRREAIRMDLTGDDDELIQDLVQDIETQLDEVPSKFINSSIERRLLEIRLEKSEFNNGDLSHPDFRQHLIAKSEEILDEFESHPDSPDSLY
ncbi:hypothetical protein [Halobacterium salinarum]|uniref:hypothetical protein n=1 Tax=Halobacterium salinarum TaxID=2242 RepID=UPI0025540775|nr:hypothetical protein [Halobacterium salinarum]MDL0121794.1 hypothetical protein [Halobacterium salinarum]